MRIVMTIAALSLSMALTAQTRVNKTIPVRTGQSVKINFDFPELVKVSTWDKNEISISASVSINDGESDDAFELLIDNSGNIISIRNKKFDFDKLPRRVTVKRNGEKMVFRNEKEWEKYRDEHGMSGSMISNGVDMDIIIDIKIPRQTETTVQLVYGTLEVSNFSGPLVAKSTYGGVDASLAEKGIGEVSAETHYGKIYSNLDIQFDESRGREEAFRTYVYAKPGNGSSLSFTSTYGNVYLRKSN